MHRSGGEVGLGADLAVVQFFKQAFIAAAGDVGGFDFYHVPGDFLGLDHGLDLGLLAVVFHADDLGAVGLLVGFEVSLLLRRAIGAAKVHHGELALGQHGQG